MDGPGLSPNVPCSGGEIDMDEKDVPAASFNFAVPLTSATTTPIALLSSGIVSPTELTIVIFSVVGLSHTPVKVVPKLIEPPPTLVLNVKSELTSETLG